MSEPTKENRDRAVFIAAQFSRDYLYAHRIEPPALAKLIAAVRTKSHNDALERCASLCENARPTGGRAWDKAQAACFDALTHVAQHIRAKKEPT